MLNSFCFYCLSVLSLVGHAENDILLFMTKHDLKLTQDLYAAWLESNLMWSHCKPQGRIHLGMAVYSSRWWLLSWIPSRGFIYHLLQPLYGFGILCLYLINFVKLLPSVSDFIVHKPSLMGFGQKYPNECSSSAWKVMFITEWQS